MNKVIVKNIKFGSFMKISLLSSIAMGVVFGCFVFIIGLIGGNVQANLGASVLTGIAGGVASLFMGPLIFAMFGAFTGLIGFLPFKLVLKICNGLSVNGDFESLDSSDEYNQNIDVE